jgi:hypothetical protein
MKNIIIKLLFIAAAAASFTACDFWSPGIRIYETKSFQFSTNNNKTLSISLDTGMVVFLNSNDPYIRVVMTNFVDAGGYSYGKKLLEDNDLFSVSSNNQSIIITQNKTITVDYWNVYGVGTEIMVYLPIGVSILTQKVNSATASIFYDNSNYTPYLEINTTTGTVDLLPLNAGTVKINTTTGSVNFSHVTCNSFSVISSTGNITKKAGEINSPLIYLEVTTGSINTSVKNVNKLTVLTTTGNTEIDFVSFQQAGSYASIQATSGSITTYFSAAAASSLRADAAVTTGSIHSGITFNTTIKDTHFTGAEFIAQNGSGSNPVTIRITTGNINIKSK